LNRGAVFLPLWVLPPAIFMSRYQDSGHSEVTEPDPQVPTGRAIRALPASTVGGFAMASIALVVIAALSYRSLRERTATAERTSHTIAVLDQVEGVLSTLKDAETGQRGYLLTGDADYLRPYAQAVATLDDELASLRRLTAGDPQRGLQVEALDRVAAQKMAELEKTIDLRRSGKAAEALALVHTDAGRLAMDRARLLTAQIRADEEKLLEAGNLAWQQAVATSTSVTWGGSAVLMFLFVGAAVLTSRDFRSRAREAWIRAGQAALATAEQGDRRLEALADQLLPVLARTLDAQVGAMYVPAAGDDGAFQRCAGYALAPGPRPTDEPVLRPGDGLCGQAAKDNRIIQVHDVPDQYLVVSSALGQTRPRHLVIAPASVDGQVHAVVELGFLRAPTASDIELLRRATASIAIAVRSARDRSRLEGLLEETQRQAEELQAQQEELRISNDELEKQGQELRASRHLLENQQAELEQSNMQLGEQARRLESHRDDLLIIERQLTEKAVELERVNQYKSEFLANMSHELRTPLNSSLIMARLLAENRAGNLSGEQVQFAETIVSSGNDLLSLINDVLDLAKIDAGKAEVNVESVDLTRALAAATTMFQPLARQKGLALQAELDDAAPRTLQTDPQRLQQILRNLLANAFKFTESGQVSLSVRAAGNDDVAFVVRDTGIGIPAAQQEIIFEAFRQADGTTHRRFGGTGLGLSISRDLARLLGGDIRVESAVGEGSAFTLTLPRQFRGAEAGAAGAQTGTKIVTTTGTAGAPVADNIRAVRAPTTGTSAASSNGGSSAVSASQVPPAADDDRDALVPGHRVILVIEDDRAFAGVVSELAHELQFQCLLAASADEGVALAKKHIPSAIILDMTLPDHSGLSVLDRLKRAPETRHIPVHVVSASDYSRTAMTMGAIGYMLKPVKREELAQALRKLEARLAQKVRRVLIIEQDDVQRDSVTRLLAVDEVETVAVATAADALRRLRETTFDCLVMDLALPDVTGFELLEQMMKDDTCSVPPVIVHTARSLTPDEEQRLHRYSRSIIIKGARSPERLLEEVTLFLHQVESSLPPERQRMLRRARDREEMFEQRRILVVEDDVRNVFALSSVFEPRGALVEIARNGREALQRLDEATGSSGAPDLVLMDIMMPEMDGLTAIREIRKRAEWKKLPIIALTAKAMKDDQETCLAAGANDYLAKPLDLEKLLSLARIWMAK
jgi:signal transduction histidine kinase/DNA-binding response OmpR family regulator/CHASE3 domain sensor protein